MKKIVKGRIEKHYCDCCEKSIYDYIPKPSTLKVFGMPVPEYGMKVHHDFRRYKSKEYCKECYNDIFEK